MSLILEKDWVFLEPDPALVQTISEELGISKLLAALLVNRGIKDVKTAGAYFQKDLVLADPFLMKGMEQAAERIWEAVKRGEQIVIFGDYDVDGITSVTVLYSFLRSLGAKVRYRLPKREEGYGLNQKAVEECAEDGVTLIVTVDTGIAAFREAALCQTYGIDLVVTDHHEPQDRLPEASVIVNPCQKDCTYPFKGLAGVGVAFQLVRAMAGEENDSRMADYYLDFVAIGTIADISPMTGENRRIVQNGLLLLNSRCCCGLQCLIEKAGLAFRKMDVEAVAFGLAPRLNAAGRVGDPEQALKLLLSENHEEALPFAEELCGDNQIRQKYEQEIMQQVFTEIETDCVHAGCSVLVVAGENWHSGVIGIVASRVMERYGKPALLITLEGESGKGSGRSYQGFHLFDAIHSGAELLEQHGGHALAVGFSIRKEKIAAFRKAVNTYAQKNAPDLAPKLLIDRTVTVSETEVGNAEAIRSLAPFGNGNLDPVLALKSVEVVEIMPLSKGAHVKLTVSDGKHKTDILYFRKKPEELPYGRGDMVDVAFQLGVNVYMGRKSASLIMKGIRAACTEEERPAVAMYRRSEKKGILAPEGVPQKEEAAFVYRCLLKTGKVKREINLLTLTGRIKRECPAINYCKLRILIDIFTELHLMQCTFRTESIVRITMNRVENKVNLNDSVTTKKWGILFE